MPSCCTACAKLMTIYVLKIHWLTRKWKHLFAIHRGQIFFQCLLLYTLHFKGIYFTFYFTTPILGALYKKPVSDAYEFLTIPPKTLFPSKVNEADGFTEITLKEEELKSKYQRETDRFVYQYIFFYFFLFLLIIYKPLRYTLWPFEGAQSLYRGSFDFQPVVFPR